MSQDSDGTQTPATEEDMVRHELGNASLLLDAGIRLLRERHPGEDDDILRMLVEGKRRIDTIGT